MQRLLLASLFTFCFSATAAADTYIHGSVGEAEFSTGGSPDMYEIGLGLGLTPNLSLEFSYLNLGSVDSINNASEWSNWEADGYNFSLVVDVPLSETLGIYASAGSLRWDDTERYYLDGYHEETVVYQGSDWNYGLGVKAEVFEGLNLKFGYAEYKLDEVEVDSITAGIVYRF